jgi:hypothetical protein
MAKRLIPRKALCEAGLGVLAGLFKQSKVKLPQWVYMNLFAHTAADPAQSSMRSGFGCFGRVYLSKAKLSCRNGST